MKPWKIFLFFLLILLTLSLISYLYPKDGISVSSTIKLRFVSLENIFKNETAKYADISQIVKTDTLTIQKTNKSIIKNKIKSTTTNKINTDTLSISTPSDSNFYFKNNVDLYTFFTSVSNLNTASKPMHILHYGDSQIEGDRITAVLRRKFQYRFGGYGVGMLAIVQVVKNLTIDINESFNWKRYAIFGKKDSVFRYNRFGAMLSFSRFADATSTSDVLHSAYFKVSGFDKYRYIDKRDYNLTLYCGYSKTPLYIETLDANNKVLRNDTLNTASTLNVYHQSCNSALPSELFKVKGKTSPDFYALSVESKQGVIVDNIPMRGSSGLEFAKSDFSLLRAMYDSLNVNMVILQFGVNVVPSVLTNYNFYEQAFYRQLMILKKLRPGVCIVVIGVSDVSHKNGDNYETYPNVEKIRDAQKNAALRAGCVFWDLYKAMGGKNSMPSWVLANPPLANKDFTHFNQLGANIIGQMFYNAIMKEYNKWLESKHYSNTTYNN